MVSKWYRKEHPLLVSLDGDVQFPGVYEVKIGITVNDLLIRAGGGAGQDIIVVLPGGFSMPWIMPDQCDIPLDPEALHALGTGMGASIVSVGERRSLVEVVTEILRFVARESCGTCLLCVRGTTELADFFSGHLVDCTVGELERLRVKAQRFRHKGICSFMDTAVRMGEMGLEAIPRSLGTI